MRNVNFFIVLVLLMRLLTVSAQDTLTPGRAALLVEPKGASDVAQLKIAIADADPAKLAAGRSSRSHVQRAKRGLAAAGRSHLW